MKDPARKPFRGQRLGEDERQQLRDRALAGDLDACSALARNAVLETRRLPRRNS